MRNTLRLILGISAISTLALATGPSQAATGTGPYYAEPAWDQKQPAATRFIVLTDWNSQAVLDRETGLVWEQSPLPGEETWRFARVECIDRTTGGRLGWRLPTVHELASLLDPNAAAAPHLPSGHPFTNVQSSTYWSASTVTDAPNSAWVIRFQFASAQVSSDVKTASHFSWCVRGGQNHGDGY